MINIKDAYITGWNSPSKEDLEKLSEIKELQDKHGNYQYKWIDGEVIFDPQELTPEQIEKERTDLIEKEIPFTIAEEIALINKGIKDKEDPEYLEYREIIENIKLKYPKELKE